MKKKIYAWVMVQQVPKGSSFSSALKREKPEWFAYVAAELAPLRNGKIKEQQFYDWVFPSAAKTCRSCDTPTNFFGLKEGGYRAYCSAKCSAASDETKEKKSASFKARTGYDNPSQDPEVKRQKAKTTLKNHGVVNPLQSAVIKDKARATHKARTGYDNPSQTPGYKDAIKRTSLERYGVDHWMKAEGSSAKIQALYEAKTGYRNPNQNPVVQRQREATNLAKYGVPNPAQAASVKAKMARTNLERYGVPNATMNPEFVRKALKSSFEKRTIVIGRKTFEVQGANEERLLYKLVEKYGVRDVFTSNHADFSVERCNELGWLLDFYVKSIDRFIECKSPWTFVRDVPMWRRYRELARNAEGLVTWMVHVRSAKRYVVLADDWHKLTYSELAVALRMELLDFCKIVLTAKNVGYAFNRKTGILKTENGLKVNLIKKQWIGSGPPIEVGPAFAKYLCKGV